MRFRGACRTCRCSRLIGRSIRTFILMCLRLGSRFNLACRSLVILNVPFYGCGSRIEIFIIKSFQGIQRNPLSCSTGGSLGET